MKNDPAGANRRNINVKRNFGNYSPKGSLNFLWAGNVR